MDKKSLTAVARQQLKLASTASSGRSSQTIYGGTSRSLSQTVIGLSAGKSTSEHGLNGEATLYILSGKLQLIAGDNTWKGSTGDLLVVPHTRHKVEALEDVAFLLTVAK